MDKKQMKIKEPGLWEVQDSHLAFPSSLTDLILFDGLKPSLATVSMPSQYALKMCVCVCFSQY